MTLSPSQKPRDDSSKSIEALISKPISRMNWRKSAECIAKEKRLKLEAEKAEEQRQQATDMLERKRDKLEQIRKHYLHGMENEEPVYLGARLILNIFCELFDTDVKMMKGRSRRKETATQRHILAFIMYNNSVRSLPQIGKTLGGRDHTTILNSIRRVEENPELYAKAKLAEAEVLNELRGK